MARVKNLLRAKAYHDLRNRHCELIESELDRMRDQLLRADRLATLGTLAGGVGHELNNVATVLMYATEAVRGSMEAGEPASAEDVEMLADSLRHVTLHARQLLDMGRPGHDDEVDLDVREIVESVLEMLRLVGRTKQVDVQVCLPADPVRRVLNRTRLEQIFLNLIGNAADAVVAADGARRQIQISVEQAAGGRVACRIEDTGTGIPADKLEAIFEPYFTTKEPGQGTGLGLSVVRNILRGWNTELTVRSTPGEGSVFAFEFGEAGRDR